MRTKYPALHRYSGRTCVVFGVVGSVAGGILGGYHYFDKNPTYGKIPNAMGVQFCTLVTCTCLYKAVKAIIHKDIPTHKLWMSRYAGAMWGIFLIFRLIFLLVGPLFTLMKLNAGTTYNVSSWTSGPIGIVIANYVHAKNMREEAAAKAAGPLEYDSDAEPFEKGIRMAPVNAMQVTMTAGRGSFEITPWS